MTRWLLSLLLFVGSAWAACPDCEDSTLYQVVTVDATEIDEQPEFFIIALSDMDPAWQEALADSGDTTGASIRVTLDDASTEVAIFPVGVAVVGDAVTGTLVVEAGSVSASVDVDFHIYTGMVGATMRAATDTYGRNAVFAGYAGAYMPGMFLTDLTGAGRDLTAVNSPGTAASSIEGVLAANYNAASTQYHHYSGTQAVTNWPVTMEALAYTTSLALTQRPFQMSSSTSTISQFGLQYSGTVANDPFRGFANGTTGNTSTADINNYSTSTWHYLAVDRDANSGTLHARIDGSSASNSTTITAPSFNRISLGAGIDNSGVFGKMTGRVAIALLSASVRSANFISTMDTVFDAGVYTTGAVVDVGGGNTPLHLLLISEE